MSCAIRIQYKLKELHAHGRLVNLVPELGLESALQSQWTVHVKQNRHLRERSMYKLYLRGHSPLIAAVKNLAVCSADAAISAPWSSCTSLVNLCPQHSNVDLHLQEG